MEEETKKLSQWEEDLILGYLWANIDEEEYDDIVIKAGRVLGVWRGLAGGWGGHETIGEASEILLEAREWEAMWETEFMESYEEGNV